MAPGAVGTDLVEDPVSYTTINGMRSARYPLQGCAACGPVGYYGVGQDGNTLAAAAGGTALVALIGLGTIAGLYYALKPPKSYKRAMARNRRRRRRR